MSGLAYSRRQLGRDATGAEWQLLRGNSPPFTGLIYGLAFCLLISLRLRASPGFKGGTSCTSPAVCGEQVWNYYKRSIRSAYRKLLRKRRLLAHRTPLSEEETLKKRTTNKPTRGAMRPASPHPLRRYSCKLCSIVFATTRIKCNSSL